MKNTPRSFFGSMSLETRDTTLQTRNPINTFFKWEQDLKNLYTSVFEWGNVPATIDIWQVEYWLMVYGKAAFFIDEVMGPLILPFTYSGGLDVYGNPINIRAYATNGYQIILSPDQYVPIYDNTLKVPCFGILSDYAKRLANIDIVIDTNVNAQRTPYLIQTQSDKELTTLTAAYNNVQSGKPAIVAIGNAVPDGLKVFTTAAPVVFPNLQQQKLELLSEALTFAGIPNKGTQKKERLITDEMSAINGHVLHERNNRLLPRKRAAEQIQQRFGKYLGIPITVDFSAVEFNYGIMDMQIATPEVS